MWRASPGSTLGGHTSHGAPRPYCGAAALRNTSRAIVGSGFPQGCGAAAWPGCQPCLQPWTPVHTPRSSTHSAVHTPGLLRGQQDIRHQTLYSSTPSCKGAPPPTQPPSQEQVLQHPAELLPRCADLGQQFNWMRASLVLDRPWSWADTAHNQPAIQEEVTLPHWTLFSRPQAPGATHTNVDPSVRGATPPLLPYSSPALSTLGVPFAPQISNTSS
jgi:hypothetical protein